LQEDSGATHNTARRSWWPVLVSIPSLGDEEDSCRSGRCQVEVATCIDGRQGQTPEADQWDRREEGADDRDGPTLELNLCGLFLAGASVGTRSTYLGRGQVGVELEEGEERRVGGGLEHKHNQLQCGVSACLSPLSLTVGRRSRA
jgi:hypothetical protein